MNDKVITSAANPTIKRIKSLAQKKYRDEEGLFIVEGLRHVTDALNAGWIADMVAYDAAVKDQIQLPKTGAHFIETNPEMLSRMTGRDNAQDVIGVFKHRWNELKDVTDGTWVALENVRDPGNLGTIARTAHASGAQGIILIGQTCDPWSPEAVRASMGSFAAMQFIRASIEDFNQWRGHFRGRVVGTHVLRAEDYRDIPYTAPLILLMGNEQNGLSQAALDSCDQIAKIPMNPGAESLNLAVATGILLYEVMRQKK